MTVINYTHKQRAGLYMQNNNNKQQGMIQVTSQLPVGTSSVVDDIKVLAHVGQNPLKDEHSLVKSLDGSIQLGWRWGRNN